MPEGPAPSDTPPTVTRVRGQLDDKVRRFRFTLVTIPLPSADLAMSMTAVYMNSMVECLYFTNKYSLKLH